MIGVSNVEAAVVGRSAVLTLAVAGLVGAGCVDHTPPPPRVAVPTAGNPAYTTQRDAVKPMPWEVPPQQQGIAVGEPAPGSRPLPPQGYDDEPLLVQRPPEQRAYVDAYNRVGRPRMVVFVNRTLNGNIIPVIDTRPLGEVEKSPLTTTGPTIIEKRTTVSYGNNTPPPGGPPPGEKVEYERPGEYDEFNAKTLDYEAMENILTDWLAANGQVTVVSPSLARAKLTKEQVDALERGEKFVLTDIAQRLDADVFVQVQMHPTRQSQYGPEFRLVGESINVRGGQSLGRAVVDVPPPLSKPTLNKYTRFVARKLMDDMSGAWLGMPAPAPQQQGQPQTTPPLPQPSAPPAGVQEVPPAAPQTAPAPTTR